MVPETEVNLTHVHAVLTHHFTPTNLLSLLQLISESQKQFNLRFVFEKDLITLYLFYRVNILSLYHRKGFKRISFCLYLQKALSQPLLMYLVVKQLWQLH